MIYVRAKQQDKQQQIVDYQYCVHYKTEVVEKNQQENGNK